MITVRLDSSGRLIRLLRVPDPNFESNSEKAADWTKCFEQIGLEQDRYIEIDESELERQFRPPFFADQISVWESKRNDGDKTRLVLAARDDQLVYFNRLGSVAYDRDELPGSRIGRSGFWYVAIILALSLAWGNLKRGEADIRARESQPRRQRCARGQGHRADAVHQPRVTALRDRKTGAESS